MCVDNGIAKTVPKLEPEGAFRLRLKTGQRIERLSTGEDCETR